MNSILIIEALNIPKNLLLSLSKILNRMTIKPQSFKMSMPRFKTRIVIRITFTTVGMLDFMALQEAGYTLDLYTDFLGQNEAIDL